MDGDSKFVQPNSGFANPSVLAPDSKFVRDPNIQPVLGANHFAGHQNIGGSETKFVQEEAPKKKGPCCVCKETKFIRDECVRNNGMEDCLPQIAAHNACLKSEGYSII